MYTFWNLDTGEQIKLYAEDDHHAESIAERLQEEWDIETVDWDVVDD